MPAKKEGYDFYREVLGSPKYVVAPMVDASELAWRQLSRRYKADLCYTPMFHAGVFVRDAKYRKDSLQSCPEDRPLIVQFCANDPKIFLEAARLTVEAIECDAIDLNLGCPQIIAKRGHFGSFLQDEWDLINSIISLASKELDIPITAKCRIFPELEKSIEYAQMLEKAGAQLITVHGRTREQKGPLTGLADWSYIKAVKESVSVPVFANGNIQSRADADRCMQETGVDGVMSAEGNLTNPAIFAGISPPMWEIALEYLDLAEAHPCPISYVRGHIFKMLHHCLQLQHNFDLREIIAKTSQMEGFREAVVKLKERYIDYHTGVKKYDNKEEMIRLNIKLPPWICQPYVRLSPEEYKLKMAKITEEQKKEQLENPKKRDNEGAADTEGEQTISKKKKKKMERNPHKNFLRERQGCKLCSGCKMPASPKCDYELCKNCCKAKIVKEKLDCNGHKSFLKLRRTDAEVILEKERLQENNKSGIENKDFTTAEQ